MLDINKIEKEFDRYTSNYDPNSPRISLKINHLKRVVKNCEKIETETNSNPKIIIEDTSLKNNLLISRQSHYDKIKRYFRGEKKKTILKILILISSIILIISTKIIRHS